ncbi:hypothetical protein TNCV_4191331 [Trichonephila clavipes]|nr:hypothetical protein TNCV_4191331 [Trichonephila clavipes]
MWIVSIVHDFSQQWPRVESYGQPLPQENHGPTTHGSPLTGKTTVPSTPNHCNCDFSDVTLEIIGQWSGNVLCSLIKAVSVSLPVIAVIYLKKAKSALANNLSAA